MREGPAGRLDDAHGEGPALSCVAALALLAATSATASDDASPKPKRVLILESFSRDFSPFNHLSLALRGEVTRLQGAPIEFLQVSIEAQSLPPIDEGAIVDYVRALCASRAPDLVITTAVPAFQFSRKHRQSLLPGVPAVHGAADERLFQGVTLSPGETAVASRLDLPGFVENVLTVLPKTREVYLVFGTSPLERFWSAEFLRATEPLAPRVRVDGRAFEGLSYDEILRRAAALPPRSAIFFGLLARDAHGLPYQNERALERLSRTANAPGLHLVDRHGRSRGRRRKARADRGARRRDRRGLPTGFSGARRRRRSP